MNVNQLRADIVEVLERHAKGIAAFAFAVTYTDGGQLHVDGATLVPVPARDHEEEILRDQCAKEVCDKVVKLTKNVYEGR